MSDAETAPQQVKNQPEGSTSTNSDSPIRRRLPEKWNRRRSRWLRRGSYEAMRKFGVSAVSPFVEETTLCIAYMCPWAHWCKRAAPRPALVKQTACLRMESLNTRPSSGLSDHALDTLAKHRSEKQKINDATLMILDQFRPTGPTKSFGMKKPSRPVR